ncbi:MAG: radical SAM protein [Candidatus Nanoarchaeia archaeon]|jgi:radical SAM superfamily enzyme YgiQ (UPF0313 family)
MVKILFLQQIWFPFQGVMTLSAALKRAGHETAVAVGKDERLFKEIYEFKPDIIAFPVITSYRRFMIETVKKIKAKNIKALIAIGGYDASFFPQIIEKLPINVLCIGEGDDAFVEFANAVKEGKDYSHIKNLWVKHNGKIIKNPIRSFKDLKNKPFDDRDIYRDYDSYFKDIEFEQVMVGRGCPYCCSYCFNHKYRELYAPVDKQYCALRDVDNVIEECLILKNKYKVKNLFFNDSTLGYDKKWILKFLKEYRERVNMPFSINACANELTEDVCKALADTKQCYIIRLGLETGNEDLRFNVLNKKMTNKQYMDATNLLKKYKLKYSMAVMFGLPGETLANSFETLDLAIKLSDKNTVVAVNIFKPFPKLNITEYGVKHGFYKSELINDSNLIGDNVMNFFECFRQDEEGRVILNLSRLSQIYLHFPILRKLIRTKLIYRSDNAIYRAIWKFSDYYYTSRHHINASLPFLFKYVFKHMGKGVRG